MKIFDAAYQAISVHRVFYRFTDQVWLCPACPTWQGMDQNGADLHVAEAVDTLADS